MGLSNEERSTGIYFCLKNLVEESRKLDDSGYDSDNIKRLKEICSSANVWHSFLGGNSNSLHWIVGSEAGNTIRDESLGPWATAIKTHLREWHDDHNDSVLKLKDDDFNVFNGFLSVEGLLGHWSQNARTVFIIFGISESLSYRLRRYDDDFMRERDAVNRLISEIQGLCFSIFSSEKKYSMAYLLNKMCEIIYGSTYYTYKEDQDWVTEWLVKDHIHHDLNRPMSENYDFDAAFASIVRTHIHLTTAWLNKDKKKDELYFERVCAALIVAGRKFHYVHKHKPLLVLCEKHGFTEEQMKEIKGYLRHCIRMHEKEEARTKERYSTTGQELEVHGYFYEKP